VEFVSTAKQMTAPCRVPRPRFWRAGLLTPPFLDTASRQKLIILTSSQAQFKSIFAIPKHPNHLQVTIDRRYQYAIMVSLSRHFPSVPCNPCAPTLRSF